MLFTVECLGWLAEPLESEHSCQEVSQVLGGSNEEALLHMGLYLPWSAALWVEAPSALRKGLSMCEAASGSCAFSVSSVCVSPTPGEQKAERPQTKPINNCFCVLVIQMFLSFRLAFPHCCPLLAG